MYSWEIETLGLASYTAVDRFFQAFVIPQNRKTVQIRKDSVRPFMRKVSLDESRKVT